MTRYGSVKPHLWGLDIPGMVRTLGPRAVHDRAIALTFDACGGPHPTSSGCGVDADLIALLRTHRARATLFLNARWMKANPQVTASLIADPLFEIANHGQQHKPLSVSGRKGYSEQGTRSAGEVYDEVAGNHELLTRLVGKPPRWFRSGTDYADEVALQIVRDLGEQFAAFAVNGDAGTTFTASQIVTSVAETRPGDIIISHMNRPARSTAEGYAIALPRLLARGLKPVHLSEYL